ncbi:hypothetical protein [Anaerotignum sp.]|uniref:hypothetical protein n=1 Tax=Anaerotignum sp. TaxID=2039241 RepID=UPI002714A0CC|nr:hypothetical protein [Anaerotignum sp.]
MSLKRTAGMSDFETLLLKNEITYNDRWKPTIVDPFKKAVSQGILEDIDTHIKNNISYNLQYLQYLQLQINEIDFHSIVKCLIYKTYIITAMSIVEAIFYQVLKKSGQWSMTDGWNNIGIVKTTEYSEEEQKRKMEIHIFEKGSKSEKEMDFKSIINKIKDKGLLEIKSEYFSKISALRKLRNRVHLQIGEADNDTDYYKFQAEDYKLVKETLYSVLTDPKILVDRTQTNIYDFLI